jgi:hypothetical protein
MVTREQIETVLDDENKASYVTKDIDHTVKAISLLRERIPYEKVRRIIKGASGGMLYLCAIEEAIPYLTEDDLVVLADCNCWLEKDYEFISLYV